MASSSWPPTTFSSLLSPFKIIFSCFPTALVFEFPPSFQRFGCLFDREMFFSFLISCHCSCRIHWLIRLFSSSHAEYFKDTLDRSLCLFQTTCLHTRFFKSTVKRVYSATQHSRVSPCPSWSGCIRMMKREPLHCICWSTACSTTTSTRSNHSV